VRIALVIGARPNFIKATALQHAAISSPSVQYVTVTTGQHNTPEMAQEHLLMREPDYRLDVSAGSPAQQLSQITCRLEPTLACIKPDAVLVVGDVTSTLAGAITAKYLNLPLIHYEAGLRCGDFTMLEEHNRRVTDHLSDQLFCTESSAIKNLVAEGVRHEPILVGNIMVDAIAQLPLNPTREISDDYLYLTMHRPVNVDDVPTFSRILQALGEIDIPIVWPIHPRARRALETHRMRIPKNIEITVPCNHAKNICLIRYATAIATDSGGVSEEAAYLKRPCIVLRTSTERPSTLACNSSWLVGSDPVLIKKYEDAATHGSWPTITDIPLWDGHAAERLTHELERIYG